MILAQQQAEVDRRKQEMDFKDQQRIEVWLLRSIIVSTRVVLSLVVEAKADAVGAEETGERT